jgi:small-conductance mechanosensitive channel
MPQPTTSPETARLIAESGAEMAAAKTAEQAADLSVQHSLQRMGEFLSGGAPQWFSLSWVLGLLVAAVAISWGLGRLMKLTGLRRARKWLALARVVLWSFVILNLIFAVCFALSTHYWLPLGVLTVAMLGLAALPWLRNVTAGLAVAFEAQFEVGDPVEHGGVGGEITHFGARAVTLRADDGTLHQVPNQSFAEDSVTRIESEGDAACEITVTLPAGVSPERAMRLAQQAAFLTPLASPRHRPEVFLDMDPHAHDGIELRIRGFAFDPAWRESFRSDVVARIHDLMRTEKSAASARRT